MTNITLAVPEDMKKEMDKFPEINWSEIARAAIRQRLMMLENFRKFSKESALTEEHALNLGRKVNKSLSQKYK